MGSRRIKVSTTKTIIEQNIVNSKSSIFYDAKVTLGAQGINQTKLPVRVVGYKIGGVEYFVATDMILQLNKLQPYTNSGGKLRHFFNGGSNI